MKIEHANAEQPAPTDQRFKVLCRYRLNRNEKWQAYARPMPKTSGRRWADKDTAQLEADATMRQYPHIEATVMDAEQADQEVMS